MKISSQLRVKHTRTLGKSKWGSHRAIRVALVAPIADTHRYVGLSQSLPINQLLTHENTQTHRHHRRLPGSDNQQNVMRLCKCLPDLRVQLL